MEVRDRLNPQRSYRKVFALKGLHQHIIKTNNPSTIGPGKLLTMRKCTNERLNAVFQGIVEADSQTENAIRHRINAGDKANDAEDQTVASIYDNHFCIPLDFEILESSLPPYQYGLGSRLTYELTFADYSDVIKANKPGATYTIFNISLEFDTIINASLASQIRTEYMKSSILYDRILRACILHLDKSDTSFSVDINSPSKSLKGVLLIFTQERSATKFA